MKIIPSDYKIADPMKKSPKGFTTTIERVPGSKMKKPKILEEIKKVVEKVESDAPEKPKSKKKSLGDLLEGGLI